MGLPFALEVLAAQGQRSDLTSAHLRRSWDGYCVDIGSTKRTVNRRLANAKRSAATTEQHKVSNPRAGESMVVVQSVPPPDHEPKDRIAKAAASKTNMGAGKNN